MKANYSGYYRPGMHSDAQLPCDRSLFCHLLGNTQHVKGSQDGIYRMRGTAHRQAAGEHVTVTDGLQFLYAVAFHDVVKGSEVLVENVDKFIGWKLFRGE